MAFLVGLVAAVAASANFPVLVSSIFWRGMTTRGAVIGGSLGLVSAVLLTLFSKVGLGRRAAPGARAGVPRQSRAGFRAARVCGHMVFSLLDHGARARREREAFALQEFYGQTGVLSAKAVEH